MNQKNNSNEERVIEIEIAFDGDHDTHENTVTVFVVGDVNNVVEVQTRAGQLADEEWPGRFGKETTAMLTGWSSCDRAEWRQFIDDTQPDVLIGPNVPV